MLVLSRQRDQTIMIGDDIELTVVDIRGGTVSLGVNAPTEVPVHRKEVYDAIKRENRAAASLKLEDIANVAGPRSKAGVFGEGLLENTSNVGGSPVPELIVEAAIPASDQ